MTKKRIRYSDLASPATPAASTTPAAPTVPAAQTAPGVPAEAPAPAPAAVRVERALFDGEPSSSAGPLAAAAAPPIPTRTTDSPRALRERARARVGQIEILLFRVARERFAIELAAVEEAIDIPPVHHVPEMPVSMLGVITVRGMLTSVYSPAGPLGLALHDGTSALIFRRGRTRIAVVVDEVDDVATLDLASLRDAPTLDTGESIVLGVVRQHDALLALVDAEALIAGCQAAPLLETA